VGSCPALPSERWGPVCWRETLPASSSMGPAWWQHWSGPQRSFSHKHEQGRHSTGGTLMEPQGAVGGIGGG
jgi:hypothetical protein